MTKKMRQIRDELVTYNNSLREAEEELNKLYKQNKQTNADVNKIKELKERVNYLSEIVQSLCLKEYDELFPHKEIKMTTVSSISGFVEALI